MKVWESILNTKKKTSWGNIFVVKKNGGRRTPPRPPDNHPPFGCPGPSSGMVSTLNGSTNLRLSSVEASTFRWCEVSNFNKCNESDSLCFQRVLKDWDVPRVCGSSSFHFSHVVTPTPKWNEQREAWVHCARGPSDDLTIFASSSNPIG